MAAGKSSAVLGNANDESLRQRKPALDEGAGAYVTEHGREMDKKLEQHQS